MTLIEPETAAKKRPERGGGVQSLERAFSILETVATHPEGISLADLSKSVGLHNSTTFHLVKTMESCGYIRQDPETKRYYVGRMIYSIAANSKTDLDLVAIAEPVLRELARETGESSHLAVLSGEDIVLIARTAGAGAFQLQERHGGMRPGHATAVGKIILSSLSESDLQRYLERHPPVALTPRTITERELLDAEIARVRETGFAYDDGEFNPEVRCVAHGVRDFTNKVVGAIGVSGPIWRLTLQSLGELSQQVAHAAERLSAELGQNAPTAATPARKRAR